MNRISERGFTLLEMICVLALIAMMAAVLLPFVPHHTSRSRLQGYVLQTAALLKGDRNAAIRSGTGVAAWNGPYLKGNTLPNDPWNHPYVYRAPGDHAPYEILSYGSDGQEGGSGIAADISTENLVNAKNE